MVPYSTNGTNALPILTGRGYVLTMDLIEQHRASVAEFFDRTDCDWGDGDDAFVAIVVIVGEELCGAREQYWIPQFSDDLNTPFDAALGWLDDDDARRELRSAALSDHFTSVLVTCEDKVAKTGLAILERYGTRMQLDGGFVVPTTALEVAVSALEQTPDCRAQKSLVRFIAAQIRFADRVISPTRLVNVLRGRRSKTAKQALERLAQQ